MRLSSVGLAASMACACASNPAPPSVVGHSVPHVSLVTVDGHASDIDVVRGGKPALVTFWASWCVACREELPALNRLEDQVRSEGGVVIGVAVGEPPGVAGAFARRHDLHYALLVDEAFALADALGQREIPATIVVDRGGNVTFAGGALDAPALAAFRAAMHPEK